VYDSRTGRVVNREALSQRKRLERERALDGGKAAPEFRCNVIARRNKEFVDHTLPRRGQNQILDESISRAGAGWDAAGRPRFQGRRQIDEVASRTQGEDPGGGYAYDYGETQ
jgi:hypothetical protein